RFELTSGPTGMTVDSASGRISWTVGNFTGQRVKVTITDGKGGKVVHGYELPISTELSSGRSINISAPIGSTGFATVVVPAGGTMLQVTLRGSAGDADLFVRDPNGNLSLSSRIGSNETL